MRWVCFLKGYTDVRTREGAMKKKANKEAASHGLVAYMFRLVIFGLAARGGAPLDE